MIPCPPEYAPPVDGLVDSFSVRVSRDRSSRNLLSVRSAEDDFIDSLPSRGMRPTREAVSMANALAMDKLLQSGRFKSLTQFASYLGISKSVLIRHLNMLNYPIEEQERCLLSTF